MLKRILSLFKRPDPAPRAAAKYPNAIAPAYAAPAASTPRAKPKTQAGQAVPYSLPATVGDAIDGANIYVRSHADEDNPARIFVEMCGFRPFIFNAPGARAFLVRVFPELSDRELKTAVSRIDTRVRARVRESVERLDYLSRIENGTDIPWIDRY